MFGISDINRKFYPIAFMIISHETEIDYVDFFKSLKDVCRLEKFEINGWLLKNIFRNKKIFN